jgi:hypothetical protein
MLSTAASSIRISASQIFLTPLNALGNFKFLPLSHYIARMAAVSGRSGLTDYSTEKNNKKAPAGKKMREPQSAFFR